MELDSLRPRRVGVFALGVGSFAVLLWLNPTLPDLLAYTLVSIPLALCYYGVTARSPRTVVFRLGLVVAGLIVGNALRDAGIL